jgi:hypothetical protein
MKKYFKLIFLFAVSSIWSQTIINNSFITKSNQSSLIQKTNQYKIADSFLSNNKREIIDDRNFFYSINKTTGFNESFYLKSSTNTLNQSNYNTLVEPTNAISFPMYTKKDSFNPHGTQNIGAAIVLGVFDLLTAK